MLRDKGRDLGFGGDQEWLMRLRELMMAHKRPTTMGASPPADGAAPRLSRWLAGPDRIEVIALTRASRSDCEV